jgi:hypothetical protein
MDEIVQFKEEQMKAENAKQEKGPNFVPEKQDSEDGDLELFVR